MQRALGIVAGLGVHALFLVTVVRLFWFLRDTRDNSVAGPLGWDVLLALQFAVPHSLLLYPAVRRRLTKIVAPAFYGLLYTTVTCGSLWTMFAWWRQSSVEIWHFEGMAATIMSAGFYASWVSLFYSLHLTGLGWQTGWTPWYQWFRRKPQPKRKFEPRGVYRFVRHPVYLSFLGLVWFTPIMSLDRAILTGIWSAYLFYGSYLKDERLAFYMGQTYRNYQSRVIGYPGVFFGPLGKRAADLSTAERVG